MEFDKFPLDSNESMTRLHGWWSRSTWLLTPAEGQHMNYGNQAIGYSQAGGAAINPYPAATSAPLPISPMQESRNILGQSIQNLHDRMGEIERRLEPICRASVPTPDGVNGIVGDPSSSAVRSFLDEQSRAVGNACDRLDSLLARIEL